MKIFRKKSIVIAIALFLIMGVAACQYYVYRQNNKFTVDVELTPIHTSLVEGNTLAYKATNWGYSDVFVREVVVLSVYDENGEPVPAGGSAYCASSAELLGGDLSQQKAVQDNQIIYVSEYTMRAFTGLLKSAHYAGEQEDNRYLSKYDLRVDAGRNVRVDVILQGRVETGVEWETAGSASAFFGDNTHALRLLEENAKVPDLTHTVSYAWQIGGNKAVLVGLGEISEKDIIIPSQIMLSRVEGVATYDPINGREYPVEVGSVSFFETDIETVCFRDGVTIEKNTMGRDDYVSQRGLFENCTSLVAVENIPDAVTDMPYTFKGCTMLAQPPELPENIQNMKGCFQNCTSLEKMPELPQKYVIYNDCFRGCSSLTGKVEIPVEVVNFETYFPNIKDMFTGCKKLDAIVVPCCKRGDVATLLPKNIDISYQFTHQKKGLCQGCSHITDTYKVDGLTVYFDDISQVFVQGILYILDTEIPDAIKKTCPKLTFTQSLGKYDIKGIWVGFAMHPSSKAYVKVSWIQFWEHDITVDEAISNKLESCKDTIAHELAHTYDLYYSLKPRHSESKQWTKLCEQEGAVFIPELEEYYRKDEYKKEMFARAVARYVVDSQGLIEKCPGMYAYIDKLFGEAA